MTKVELPPKEIPILFQSGSYSCKVSAVHTQTRKLIFKTGIGLNFGNSRKDKL